jgi:cardiolipin synthase A/B
VAVRIVEATSAENPPAAAPESRPPAYSTRGNRLELLIDGSDAREAMIEAIAAARERVWLETFIFLPDDAGKPILEALEAAARRGVEVILLIDNGGGIFAPKRKFSALEEAGGKLLLYNPLPPWRGMGRRVATFRHRDHRKILIADEVGFCGGHNISHKYLTSRADAYYDLTLRIEGPAVRELGEVFFQTLGQVKPGAAGPLPAPEPIATGVPASVYMLDSMNRVYSAVDAMRELLRSSRGRVYLMMAYFFPSRWLIEELKAASRRGVDVRIMLIGKTDMPFVRSAARHLHAELLLGGVRLFELWEEKLHAKMVVSDGAHILLGTFDHNRFSARHSLEVMLAAQDPVLGDQLERTFLANAARCREMTLDDWQNRGWLKKQLNRMWYLILTRASKRSEG